MNTKTLKKYLSSLSLLILYGPLVILIYNVITTLLTMTTNPWGFAEYNFIIWTHDIHAPTIIYVSVLYLLLCFYFYRGLDPIIRVGCSIVMSLFGLFFYEFWWHLGCWMVWGTSQVIFWGAFVFAFIVCVHYIHLRYNILCITRSRAIILTGLLVVFIGGWWILLQQGFYQTLLLHEKGLGPDPHGWITAINKGVAVFMWLPLVRRKE